MAAVTCRAAQCTVEAAGAVQWRPRRFAPGRSRCEPACRGHLLALRLYVKEHPDPFTQVTWLDLRDYARYLERAATTVHVTI
jgi:hypothetical protein